MDDWLKDIADMVARGDTGEELQQMVKKSLDEIDREIASLQRQAVAIKSLGYYYAPEGKGPAEEPLVTARMDTGPDTSTPKKRWRLIHEAALAVAQGKETIHVRDVLSELNRMGANFPYPNVKTAIGTVLRDCPDEFNRIGSGEWKVVGKDAASASEQAQERGD